MLFYGGGINYSGDLEISCESASDITRNFRHGCLHFMNKLTVHVIMVP